jgi:hypothetical protein
MALFGDYVPDPLLICPTSKRNLSRWQEKHGPRVKKAIGS